MYVIGIVTHRDEGSFDLPVADGPLLAAVQLEHLPVLLHERDEVVLNLLVQAGGLQEGGNLKTKNASDNTVF